MKIKNVTNLTQSLVLTSTLILGMATPAHAGWFTKKEKPAEVGVDQNPAQTLNIINRAETPEQAQAAEAMLQDMSARMTEKMASIEELIKSGKSAEALTAAKALLDNVRVKTGIDPKARLRESFLAPTVFPANATGMNSLAEDQKDIVIRAVRDYRGGLYLDIMNLSKRTSLLYVKALHAEMKKSGGITQEDRNKIIQDLTVASVIPMPVLDKKGKKITVLDEDVANADHIYLFNREIKMYLLESPDLKINEAAFDEYRNKFKDSIGATVNIVKGNLKQCFATAGEMYYDSDKASAQRTCFAKFLPTLSDVNQCMSLASEMYYDSDKAAAQRSCVQKFN